MSIISNFENESSRLASKELPELGPFKYQDGTTYKGQYKEKKRHGFGIEVIVSENQLTSQKVSAEGDIFEGFWENDEKSGVGLEITTDCSLIF